MARSLFSNAFLVVFSSALLVWKSVASAETKNLAMRFTPVAVKPGEAVKISVVGSEGSRFYLHSDARWDFGLGGSPWGLDHPPHGTAAHRCRNPSGS
jgi:hypothetical protein